MPAGIAKLGTMAYGVGSKLECQALRALDDMNPEKKQFGTQRV